MRADQHAAAAMFGNVDWLIMGGLDVTDQLQATPERITLVREIPCSLPESSAPNRTVKWEVDHEAAFGAILGEVKASDN